MSRRLAVAAISLAVALVPAAGALATGRQSSQATPGSFPVTITAKNGKVTVAKRPTRIVSLSPSSTETLYAIGAGAQVVAVDELSDYPRNTPKTSLSGYTPNVEAIASYRPDLVVIGFDPKGVSDALAKLGIPVVHHDAAAHLAGAYQQMTQLGKLTGHVPEATKLVAKMKRQIAAVVQKARSRAGKTVYHELDPTYFSATSNTFIGRVYALFGLKNVADGAAGAGSDYPQLSPEFLIASNPDVIVLADTVCCGQNAETVASRPGWSSIAAVKSRTILRLDDSIASRWGPRLVNLVRAIGIALNRLDA